MASHYKKGSILFGASLLVLAFAFLSSFLATVGTIGEEYRTVGILEYNPNNYGQWMWFILWWGILPIATGLILCIADFIVQRRTRTTSSNVLQLIAGVFSALWGIYYIRVVSLSYAQAISEANQWGDTGFLPARDISSSLQKIYMGYEWIGVLWLVTGVFLAVTSAYVMYARQLGTEERDLKDTPNGNRGRKNKSNSCYGSAKFYPLMSLSLLVHKNTYSVKESRKQELPVLL